MRVDKLLTEFIRQLLAEPDDRDTPLIMADWLQDNGEEPRAALIRACAKLNAATTEGEIESAKVTHADAWNRYRPELDAEFTYSGCLQIFSDRRGFIVEVSCPVAMWVERGPIWVRRHPLRSVRFIDRHPRDDNAEIFWRCDKHRETYPEDYHERHVLPRTIVAKLKRGRKIGGPNVPWRSVFYTNLGYPNITPEMESATIEEAIQDASQAAVEVAWEIEP